MEAHELKPLGAIYRDIGEGASKHVAIVYEWRAQSEDVAVVLSSAEFFERRGTSLSGSFVSVKALVDDIQSGSLDEDWTVEIVREILAKGEFHFTGNLF